MLVGSHDVMRHHVHTHTHTYIHSGSVIRQGSMKEVTDRSWTGDKGAFNLKLVCATQSLSKLLHLCCVSVSESG